MAEVDQAAYEETENIHDRDFQIYSVTHRIYCVPVDEVRLTVCSRLLSLGVIFHAIMVVGGCPYESSTSCVSMANISKGGRG
jgi:hypothetical protein